MPDEPQHSGGPLLKRRKQKAAPAKTACVPNLSSDSQLVASSVCFLPSDLASVRLHSQPQVRCIAILVQRRCFQTVASRHGTKKSTHAAAAFKRIHALLFEEALLAWHAGSSEESQRLDVAGQVLMLL